MQEEKDVRVEILQYFYNGFTQFIHFQMTKSNLTDETRATEEQHKGTLATNLSSFHLFVFPLLNFDETVKEKAKHLKIPHTRLSRNKFTLFKTYFPLF